MQRSCPYFFLIKYYEIKRYVRLFVVFWTNPDYNVFKEAKNVQSKRGGMTEGMKKGKIEGIKEGFDKQIKEFAMKLLKAGMPLEQVSELSEIDIDEINSFAREISQK